MNTRDEPDAVRVLVVDDEESMRFIVSTALRVHGYQVDVAADGRSAIGKVATFRPHLVVLDVMMPDVDGFDTAGRLRRDGIDVPIVFLTARDATADKVGGLRLGADDYITKPFSVEELIERVKAVLRRTHATAPTERLRFADIEMDDATHEVFRGSESVKLTAIEYRVLRYFLLNPRRVLSKAQIMAHVWDYDFGSDSNLVEVYISYLRRKIDHVEPRLIHTIRGAGYILRLPAE